MTRAFIPTFWLVLTWKITVMRFIAYLVGPTPLRLVAAVWPPQFFWLYIYKLEYFRYLHAIFKKYWPKKKTKLFSIENLIHCFCATLYICTTKFGITYIELSSILKPLNTFILLLLQPAQFDVKVFIAEPEKWTVQRKWNHCVRTLLQCIFIRSIKKLILHFIKEKRWTIRKWKNIIQVGFNVIKF